MISFHHVIELMLRVVFGFKIHDVSYSSSKKEKIICFCTHFDSRTLRILQCNIQKFETDFKQNVSYLKKGQQLFPMFF
jgi:hypothetical protein